ncbi:hypothetical protein D3C71_78080 [compost metagenome]
MSEVSKLNVYSIGVVAANKELTSKEIEVTPIEDAPMTNGEVTDAGQKITAKSTDTNDASYQTEVPTSNTVKATWLPLGHTNRITAPDVRRGEKVILYRFADQDKFWWVTMEDDIRLRKLETVIFAISGTRVEDADPTADNTYFMEWSTHKKLFHIHTSKGDGEKFAYDLQINAKDGIIILQDDDGNSFSLDSNERTWLLINKDQSKIEMNKTKLFIYTKDLIQMETKDYVLKCETSDTTSSSSAKHTTPDNTLNADKAVQTSQTNELTATTNQITAQTGHLGNFGLIGSFTQTGPGGGGGGAEARFKGDIYMEGDIDVVGEIRSTGDQIAGTISQMHHTHADDGAGEPIG